MIIEIIFVFLIGLCAGSFITMASVRLVIENQKLSKLLWARSSCPKCHNKLRIRNLIPLFSWMLQKGKCSFCAAKISLGYPLIEIFTSIVFLLIYWANGSIIDAKLLLFFFIATTLIIMIITDLEHYFIPNLTQIILAILLLIYHLFFNKDPNISYYLLSSLLFVGIALSLYYGFLFFAKKNAIGIDDIKFFALAGFALGLDQLPNFMILSGGIGIIFGMIWQRIFKDQTFPFAPALTSAFMICLMSGDNILNIFL